jgi:hypothetical protein
MFSYKINYFSSISEEVTKVALTAKVSISAVLIMLGYNFLGIKLLVRQACLSMKSKYFRPLNIY